MDGTQLWRIDLGINIRAGAHYTQFMVYDLDNDGIAEIVCKTADGTTDGLGNILGDPDADHRTSAGYILSGPEYLSAFDGMTGAFIDTVDYVPARGNINDWGDDYGNRVDRFLACVAYLDGQNPSVVMCRGYYTRTVLAAWDLIDGQLTQRWVFDSDEPGNGAYYDKAATTLVSLMLTLTAMTRSYMAHALLIMMEPDCTQPALAMAMLCMYLTWTLTGRGLKYGCRMKHLLLVQPIATLKQVKY